MKFSDLKVNQLVDLEMDYNGQKVTLSSRIEGEDINHLLVATPIRKGIPLTVPVGQEITVMVRLSYGWFGFRAHVLERLSQPIPVLVINKPQEFFKVDQKRTYVRLTINLPLRFHYLNREDSEVYDGVTVDISAGGILFNTTEALTKGDKLQVELCLSEQDSIQSAAQVIRVFSKHRGNSRNCKAAVEFEDISENQRDRIFRFVFEKQREWLRKGLLK